MIDQKITEIIITKFILFIHQFGAHIFFAVPITPPFIFGAIAKEYGDLPDFRFSKLLHIDNVFIGS